MYLRTGKVLTPHGEGIYARGVVLAFNQVCEYDFNLCYLPFFTLVMSFYAFYIFFCLFVVDKGVSLAPTYSSIVIRKSDLHSSLRTKRWLNYFYPFLQDIF